MTPAPPGAAVALPWRPELPVAKSSPVVGRLDGREAREVLLLAASLRGRPQPRRFGVGVMVDNRREWLAGVLCVCVN